MVKVNVGFALNFISAKFEDFSGNETKKSSLQKLPVSRLRSMLETTVVLSFISIGRGGV
ncbi:hypothetical protein D3C78_1992610 [compost metagenome]